MKKKTQKKGRRILLGIFLTILALILAAAGFLWSKLDLIQYDHETAGQTEPPVSEVVPAFGEEDPVISEDAFQGLEESATEPKIPEAEIEQADEVLNVLLIGTDERSKTFSADARSDSMILVSINKTAKTVKLVSLERGMGVPVLEGPYAGQWDWLTHIFRYGGADLLMKTVEECFRVEVDRYVRVNFTSVTSVVDAIGGIDIEMTPAEAQFFSGTLSWPKKTGVNRMNGKEALMYARLRAIDSDWQRVERQRKVILAVTNELKTASLLELNELADQVLPMIQTNFTKLEIAELMLYAPNFMQSEFQQMTLPKHGTYGFRTGMGGRDYFAADFDENSRILQEFLYENEK